MLSYKLYRRPTKFNYGEWEWEKCQRFLSLRAKDSGDLISITHRVIAEFPKELADQIFMKYVNSKVCIYYRPVFGNPKMFFKEAIAAASCQVSCDPSDFCEGGKCDHHGCYKN